MSQSPETVTSHEKLYPATSADDPATLSEIAKGSLGGIALSSLERHAEGPNQTPPSVSHLHAARRVDFINSRLNPNAIAPLLEPPY
jgi:hypothetical protein